MPYTCRAFLRRNEKMTFINEHEALEQYDEMLDECYEEVRLGGLTFSPSRVLKKMDPVAYRCWFNDWMDSQDLTTDESEADEEESQDD
jgi:hypothetical protein